MDREGADGLQIGAGVGQSTILWEAGEFIA